MRSRRWGFPLRSDMRPVVKRRLKATVIMGLAILFAIVAISTMRRVGGLLFDGSPWTVEYDGFAVTAYVTGTDPGYADSMTDRMVVQCRGDETLVGVSWAWLLAHDRPSSVKYRISPRPATEERWDGVHYSLYFEPYWSIASAVPPDPIQFARFLAANDGEALVMETTSSAGSTHIHSTTFDLTGARAAISEVANACGWSPFIGIPRPT